MKTSEILDIIHEEAPEAQLFSGYDDALIGLITVAPGAVCALYDRQVLLGLTVQQLENEGVTGEDAWTMAEEHVAHNIESAYVGTGTPAVATLLRGKPGFAMVDIDALHGDLDAGLQKRIDKHGWDIHDSLEFTVDICKGEYREFVDEVVEPERDDDRAEEALRDLMVAAAWGLASIRARKLAALQPKDA